MQQQVSARDAELERERKERGARDERLAVLEGELEILQHELDSCSAVLQRVQKSRDDHAHGRYDLAQQINELKDELRSKLKVLQDAHMQVDALFREKGEALEEAELTQRQLHQVQEKWESVFLADQVKQKQLGELQQQVSARDAELDREREERSARDERLAVLEGELAVVKGERDGGLREKEEAQQAVEELQQQVSARDAELEKERKERSARDERLAVLEGELAVVKGERDAGLKEKVEACEEAEMILRQLHQVQEKWESVFLADQVKQKQLGELQQQIAASDAELEELQQRISAGDAELEKERRESAVGAELLKALERELIGIKVERDAGLREKVEAREEAEMILQQLDRVQEELASHAAILSLVQKSCDDHAHARYGLAQQINELKDELRAKLKALHVAHMQVDALSKEKGEAREKAEITLAQLFQVQEESERFFLETRQQGDLLHQFQKQSLAIRQEISKLVTRKA